MANGLPPIPDIPPEQRTPLIEALLAVLTTAAIIGLVFGVDRVLRRDRTALDKRLRRYGGHAYQLSDDEQKQAASAQVTQMLAKRVEASISGRTFCAQIWA